MAIRQVVINFGCPRSGTTAMRRMLGALHNVYVTKLHEPVALHPCQSADGLLTISHWMLKDVVVFVRTVRSPLAIADSFVATRLDEMRDRNASLAEYTDQRIVDYIRAESEHMAAQRAALSTMPEQEGREHYLVEVRYESLSEPDQREAFAGQVCGPLDECWPGSLKDRMDHEWGERPARDGKLKLGLENRVMPDKQEAWFRERLVDVIRREGYK